MATFKDTNGKTWTIDLDAYKIRDVRKSLDLNLAALDGDAYDRLDSDTELLVNTLWLLCREQAEKANITDESFAPLIVGDVIKHATNAMLAAIADFFPSHKRELLRAMVAKGTKVREIGMTRALAKINDPSLETEAIAAMEAEMDAELQRALTRFRAASSTPVSSALAPVE